MLFDFIFRAATSGLREQDWDHYVFAQQYPAGLCAYDVSWLSRTCFDVLLYNIKSKIASYQ